MSIMRRMAVGICDRLPRDPASDRIDWFLVCLAAGLLLAATLTAALFLVDHCFHTTLLPSSVQPQRSLKGYAAAHAFADRQLLLVGLVAGTYPPMVWLLLKMFSNRRGRIRDM